MSISPQMATFLKPIAEARHTGAVVFVNHKHPIAKALEKEGLISNTGVVDPTNADKFQFSATDAGCVAVSVPVNSTPVAAPPASIEGTAPLSATVATDTATDAKVRKARGPNTKRPDPTITRSGMRMTFEAPKRGGRGKKDEVYPFSTLEAPNGEGNDSFFIHATEALPLPAKMLSSTVGSANKRFKEDGRVFKIIAVANDPEFSVAGARVVRVK